MKKRILSGMACVLAVGMFLTGCQMPGKKSEAPTGKVLMEKMQQSSKGCKSVSADMETMMDIGFEGSDKNDAVLQQGISMNSVLAIQGNGDISKTVGTVSVGLLGRNASQSIESYADMGKGVVYTKDIKTKKWIKTKVTGMKSKDSTVSLLQNMDFSSLEKNFVVSEEKEERSGVSCYKMSGRFNGNQIGKLLKKAMQENSSLGSSISGSLLGAESKNKISEEIMKKVKVVVDVYVDANNYKPISYDIDFSKTNLADLVAGSDDKEMALAYHNAKFKTAKIVINFSKFDQVEKVTIPSSVLKNAK